jgi:hypothetical protein
VSAGQKLRIKNLSTNEETPCEVMDVNPGDATSHEVGVMFSEPCARFWRVSFPPADWNPRNPEARRYTSENASANPTRLKK